MNTRLALVGTCPVCQQKRDRPEDIHVIDNAYIRDTVCRICIGSGTESVTVELGITDAHECIFGILTFVYLTVFEFELELKIVCSLSEEGLNG